MRPKLNITPVDDEMEHDILSDQVAEALTPLPPTPDTRPGAEQLIDTAERAISGAHDAVILHIDEMITKLTSIKESIKAKRDTATSSLKEFVNLSALGLETVRDLDKTMQNLIEKHLT
jgi:hypothetical protein